LVTDTQNCTWEARTRQLIPSVSTLSSW